MFLAEDKQGVASICLMNSKQGQLCVRGFSWNPTEEMEDGTTEGASSSGLALGFVDGTRATFTALRTRSVSWVPFHPAVISPSLQLPEAMFLRFLRGTGTSFLSRFWWIIGNSLVFISFAQIFPLSHVFMAPAQDLSYIAKMGEQLPLQPTSMPFLRRLHR